MSDISRIETNGETYNVKDATARESAITVNGEDVPVSNNKAEITVSGGPEPTYGADTETLIFS